MTIPNDWTIDYRAGGWARARGGDLTVYLQLAAHGVQPRLRVCLAAVTSSEPITGSMLRSVPLADIESHFAVLSQLTNPHIDEAMQALGKPGEIDGFSVEALELYFEKSDPLPIAGMIPGGIPSAVPLRDRLTLAKPPDGRLSADFLNQVARIYLEAVGAREAPAPLIADLAGVSARTVHGWVAEARNRGILPPATRGKAG